MPKLDVKTICLSDGTELTVCWTWAAAERLRKAAGVDLIGGSEVNAIVKNLPVVIHSMLVVKEDREKYTPEDFAERIAFADLGRLSDEVFGSMFPDAPKPSKAEGQQNVPFVNGKAAEPMESDSPLNSPTQ